MSKYFDMLAYLMGKAAGGGGGGGDVTVESKSISSNGTYTAPSGKAYSPVTVSVPNSYAAGDEGKVVSNGALVAQSSDAATQNGTVDTTLINSLLVNVAQNGTDYSVRTATVSNGKSGAVDRDFDNFIFIAEIATDNFPATAPGNTSLFMSFIYFNGKYITNDIKGFQVKSTSSPNWSLAGGAANWSTASVGETSINFSTFSTSYMQNGDWKILQIELPSDFPIYNLSDRIPSA